MKEPYDPIWLETLIRKAQQEPGLEDLAQLAQLAAEANVVGQYVRESSVVYMMTSTSTATTQGLHAYLGRFIR